VPGGDGRTAWPLLTALSLCLSTAHAVERYEGVAYAPGTEQIVFRETDWLFMRDGVAQRLVLYRCPDGKPFGRKWVRETPSAVAPDFDFTDARDGYREGVRSGHGAREIFVQENARSPLQVRPLPADPNAVLDAGFDAFVRQHWRELSAGESRRIPFLIPSRFEFLDFKISSARDGLVGTRPVRFLKMGLAAWYAFALPTIELTYDRQGTRLQEFRGVSTIRNASSHNQDVRMVFPAEDDHGDIPENEVDHAAAESLTSTCSP
jgi:hypothetical protein